MKWSGCHRQAGAGVCLSMCLDLKNSQPGHCFSCTCCLCGALHALTCFVPVWQWNKRAEPWVLLLPHYFTILLTVPFPCSRHVNLPRLLYNCHCHLGSALRTGFMDEMCAVIKSLRGQAYLILSGAIKQSRVRLSKCNVWQTMRRQQWWFLLFNYSITIFKISDVWNAINQNTNKEWCF